MVTTIIMENSKTVAAVDHCGRRNHRGVPCGCLLKMGSIAQLVRAIDYINIFTKIDRFYLVILNFIYTIVYGKIKGNKNL